MKITVDLFLSDYEHNGEIEITSADEDGDLTLAIGKASVCLGVDSARQLAIALLRMADGTL